MVLITCTKMHTAASTQPAAACCAGQGPWATARGVLITCSNVHTAALSRSTLHAAIEVLSCAVQVRVLSVGDNKVALTTRTEEDRRDATELKSQGAGVKADGAVNSLEAALQRAGFAKSKKKGGGTCQCLAAHATGLMSIAALLALAG